MSAYSKAAYFLFLLTFYSVAFNATGYAEFALDKTSKDIGEIAVGESNTFLIDGEEFQIGVTEAVNGNKTTLAIGGEKRDLYQGDLFSADGKPIRVSKINQTHVSFRLEHSEELLVEPIESIVLGIQGLLFVFTGIFDLAGGLYG